MSALTKTQIAILREANDSCGVSAYAQRRRPVEKLAAQGLLRRTRLMGYQITDAGRAALTSHQRQDGTP